MKTREILYESFCSLQKDEFLNDKIQQEKDKKLQIENRYNNESLLIKKI